MSSFLQESYRKANRLLRIWNPTAYENSKTLPIQIVIPQLQNLTIKELQNIRDHKWNTINSYLKNMDETYEPPKCNTKYYFRLL